MKILVIGYSIGVAVGTALGCLIGGSKLARAVLEPFVIFLNAMPRLILFPFFVVWLGFGNAPKVLTVMLVIVTIVMVNVAAGVREVQGTYLETVRALGAGRLHVIKQVYVPSLSLWLLSTSRVSMGYAFQAAITAQFVGAQEGLGYLVNYGRQRLDVDLVYAAIFIILAIALIIDTSLRIVERRVTRWMPERS